MATKNENETKIVGAVRVKGRLYTAGQEAELAKVLPRKDIDRLHGKGVLTGNWGGKSATTETAETSTGGASAPESAETQSASATSTTGSEADAAPTTKTAKKPAAKRAAKRGK